MEVILTEAFMQAAVETLTKAFVEASMKDSMKTAATEASVEAYVEATSTEVYFLLPWKLEAKSDACYGRGLPLFFLGSSIWELKTSLKAKH